MREADYDQFSAMLNDVSSVLPPAQPLTDVGKAMFFRSLAHLPIEQVRGALDAHVRDPQRGRFFPKPADVLAQVDDGRPAAEEAWATAVRGMDEAATIVWTSETALAWGVARSVMDLGDEVGARIAFRDAYNRLVKEARASGAAIEWNASLGHDPEQREIALRAGASKLTYRPDVQIEGPRRGGAPMLALERAEGMPQDVRERLAELRTRLTGGGPREPEEMSRDAIDRKRTEDLKRETHRKVLDYARAGHPVSTQAITRALMASGEITAPTPSEFATAGWVEDRGDTA